MHRTTHEIEAALCYNMDILSVYSERHRESNRSGNKRLTKNDVRYAVSQITASDSAYLHVKRSRSDLKLESLHACSIVISALRSTSREQLLATSERSITHFPDQ